MEHDWEQPLRHALSMAVGVVKGREGCTMAELEERLAAARSAGWSIPADGYQDFWATARKVADLEGSIRQWPIKSFMDREVERNSTARG